MPLAAGSIAFVAFSFDSYNANAVNSQGFAFIVLESIAAGEQIRFVDGVMNNAATTPTPVDWQSFGRTARGPRSPRVPSSK